MKVRFKVDQDLCIPAMACIVAEPDMYFLNDNGKAETFQEIDLEKIKSVANGGDGWVEVETNDEGFQRIIESAKVCPVLAIYVEKYDETTSEWIRVYPD